MFHEYIENLKDIGRLLRKRQTDAEKLLWTKLRRKQIRRYQFLRQKPVGGYIVDFYCNKANLVIEIDGGQHCENSGIESDRKRDEFLRNLGLRVMRFTNIDVLKNIDGVVAKIYNEI